VLPRPRFRLPLWAAIAIPAAAYAVRSIARGFDFVPDMPTDAIVAALLLAIVAVVAWRRSDDERHDEPVDAETTQPAGSAPARSDAVGDGSDETGGGSTPG